MKPGRATWAWLTFAAYALAGGCSHVQLISSYDETTDREVTALHKAVSQLLDDLDAPKTPAYTSMSRRYAALGSDLRSLQFRNEARPRNALTIEQLQLLRANLDKLEQVHKEGLLVQDMVPIQRSTLDQTFRAILKLELAKKELTVSGE